MTIVRRLARPLLAAPVLQSGLDAVRHPGPRAELAGPLLARVSEPLKLPSDPVLVVRGAGALTVIAGSLLALGKLPRLSALAIVAAAPVVQGTQPFWKEKDPQLRRTQKDAALRNLGVLGGALLAAVDTEGRPGVAWRSRRAAHLTANAVRDAGAGAADAISDAQESARQRGRRAARAASKAQKKALKAAGKQTKKARKAADKARSSLPV